MVFVPSRGFLFFYCGVIVWLYLPLQFSSPHGDFSFSMKLKRVQTNTRHWFSSPHGDFSFSMMKRQPNGIRPEVSSPHGDFSFSMLLIAPTGFSSLVFVPSRGFLFFYHQLSKLLQLFFGFRPLTGISLFLSYLIFPL